MTPTALAMLGVHAAAPALRNLVLDGQILAPATLLRAQVNTRATALAAGGAWAEFLADTPRFQGAAARLLTEGQRSNGVRNPRAEGAAPGVFPSFWTGSAPNNGITGTVIGTISHAGMTGLEIEYTGTATATATLFCTFEQNTAIAAAPGQVWAGSAFQRVSAGTPPNGGTHQIRIIERNAAGGALVNHNTTTPAPTAAWQRMVGLTGVLGAEAGRISHALSVSFASGTTANCRVQFLWPQLEQAPFASTPVLPPPGTPGASTRGADLVAAALSALGVAGGGACTLLWSGMLPQAAGSAAAQAILELSDGTAANRVLVQNPAGGATLRLERATAGAGAQQALGSITPGTPFRLGLAVDGAGRAAASLEGGAALAVTGAPTAGLTTLRLGETAAGGAPMFGETRLLRLLPQTLADADLAAAVAALPA